MFYLIVLLIGWTSICNANLLNKTTVLICDENCNLASKHDCKPNASQHIYCPNGVIAIDTLYGRSDNETCLMPGSTCGSCSTNCNLSIAYNAVYTACHGKNECTIGIIVMVALMNDSCWDTFEYGLLSYSCNDTLQKKKQSSVSLMLVVFFVISTAVLLIVIAMIVMLLSTCIKTSCTQIEYV